MAKTIAALREQQDAPEEDADGKPGRLRLVVAAIVLVVVVGAIAFFLLGSSSGDEDEVGPPEDGPIAEVAQMTVNLAGPGLHYARVSFAVVMSAEEIDTRWVESRFPLLKDRALSEISAFEPDQLRAPEGLDRLRQRLTANAHELYPDGQVLRVVLTEVVVQ